MTTMELTPDLTVDDLEKLPDLGFRYELHEGNLLVMSPATAWHFEVIMRLVSALRKSGRHVSGEVGIKLGSRDSRTADVAVFHKAFDQDRAFFEPSDIAIAIEVVSPSSQEMDRINKPRHYATAGIPEYWRVERADDKDDAAIHQHELIRTADGGLAYAQARITSLKELETSGE